MTTNTETIGLSLAEETRRGELIAEVLKLRKSRIDKDRYNTTWGTKTSLGLFRTMERIVKDGE